MGSSTRRRLSRRQFAACLAATVAAVPFAHGVSPTVRGAPLALENLGALRDRLAGEIAAYPGEVGVAVTDFQTQETVEVNGAQPHVAGCTANLYLLFAVVEDLAAGRYAVGEVDWMVRAAVGASDPRWARELLIRVGGGSLTRGVDRVAGLVARLEMRNSVYDHAPGYWSQYSRANQENTISALDANAALWRLYTGQLFDARWTEYALAKLLDVRPRLNSMIPGQLPAEGVRVAHKVGFINLPGYSTRNDAGIVILDSAGGRAYAFTFLSNRNRSYAAAAPFAARLSRLVFDHFDQIY